MEESNTSKTPRSTFIAKLARSSGLYSSFVGIPVYLILIIIIVILFLTPAPIWVPFTVIIILIFFIFLSIMQFVRAKKVKLEQPVSIKPSKEGVSVEEGEQINAIIAGIMQAGFGIRSISWLGTGKIFHPENAIIITDKHIHFVYVPLQGADQIISGEDIGAWDWLIASKEILNRLESMLSSMTFSQVVSSDPRNFSLSLENLSQVKISNFFSKVTFIMKSGKKYSYSIRRKEDLNKIKEIFMSKSPKTQ